MVRMKLKSSPKLACGRSVAPEETVRRLKAILDGKHDYWVHQEQVDDHLFWSALFIEGEEFRAMGKGTTAMLSHAGALAEAAEWLACRDMAECPGYVRACPTEWEETPHLPIKDCLTHVATVTPPVLARIEAQEAACHWVDGWSFGRQSTLKVPLEYIDIISGPNGRAAGNTLEEAIEHGVLEVFERRAHITVLRNRLVLPTFTSESIDDPLIGEYLAFLRELDIEVILKDCSFGGGLPCVGAYFFDPHVPKDYQFHHFFKIGAAFNGREALIRVFTEYVQGRARDEFIRDNASELAHLLRHDFRHLPAMPNHGDNFMSAFMFGFVPYRSADFMRQGEAVAWTPAPGFADSRDDIEQAWSLCAQLGKDLIVVDHSDPDIGFHVARVIVPSYSDVLPFHPASSPGLYRRLTRSEILRSYQPPPPEAHSERLV